MLLVCIALWLRWALEIFCSHLSLTHFSVNTWARCIGEVYVARWRLTVVCAVCGPGSQAIQIMLLQALGSKWKSNWDRQLTYVVGEDWSERLQYCFSQCFLCPAVTRLVPSIEHTSGVSPCSVPSFFKPSSMARTTSKPTRSAVPPTAKFHPCLLHLIGNRCLFSACLIARCHWYPESVSRIWLVRRLCILITSARPTSRCISTTPTLAPPLLALHFAAKEGLAR